MAGQSPGDAGRQQASALNCRRWMANLVALLTGQLDVSTTTTADWFDVSGQAGTFSFPFKALWQHRKESGTAFSGCRLRLIPEAWFARFSELAEAAGIWSDDALRLPKALFTLLPSEALTDGTNDSEFQPIDPEKIDYQASDDLKLLCDPISCKASSGSSGITGRVSAPAWPMIWAWARPCKPLRCCCMRRNTKATRNKRFRRLRSSTCSRRTVRSYDHSMHSSSCRHLWCSTGKMSWRVLSPPCLSAPTPGLKRGTDARALAGYDIVLTTYQTARQDLDLLQKFPGTCWCWMKVSRSKTAHPKSRKWC